MSAFLDLTPPMPGGGDESEPGRWRRAAGRIESFPLRYAVVIVLAIVAAGIFISLHGGSKGGSSTTPAPAVAAPTTHPKARQPTDRNASIPMSAPTDIAWQSYLGVVLPYSPKAGPTLVDGSVASGYAHTPEGALIATQQIAVRSEIGSGWRRVTDLQLVPNLGQAVYVNARTGVGNDAPPTGYGQPAGFRFVTYTPDVAVIQMVTRFSDRSLQVASLTVRWQGGDWRLELQPDGSQSPNAQAVPDLTGFIGWGTL